MSDIDLFGSLYRKGDVIFEQDAPGDTLFIIQSGAVEISCLRDGEKFVLALMGQGDFFGEMALIDNRPRSATATALSRTRLLPIRRDSFIDRTKNDTSIILRLIKSLSRRIVRTNHLLRTLVLSDDSLRRGVRTETVQPSRTETEQVQTPREAPTPPETAPESIAGLFSLHLPENVDWTGTRGVRSYSQGEIIFNEGDDGTEMFIVLDGRVNIFTEAGGEKVVLNQLEAGGFFGEMALVLGTPRTAAAVAEQDTRLLALDNDQLTASLTTDPQLALFIVQALIARLRSSTIAIESPEQSVAMARNIIAPVFKEAHKVRIAMVALSTCGGCTAAIIQNQSHLARITDHADVVYCPMLMDADTIGNIDIALVDGAVRTREDELLLLEIRSKSRFLAAWGSCAAFGGIPAMANQYELEEILEESYGQAMDPFSYYLSKGEANDPHLETAETGELLRKARKLDEVVRVDFFLPGCPPLPTLIPDLIEELKGKNPAATIKPLVCAECPRKPNRRKPFEMRLFPAGKMEPGICLVSQGVVCLGQVTKGGCNAACPSGGLPCWGCRGPMQQAIHKISTGSFYEDLIVDHLARRSTLDVDSIRFVLRMLRQKGGSSLNFENNFIKDAARLR